MLEESDRVATSVRVAQIVFSDPYSKASFGTVVLIEPSKTLWDACRDEGFEVGIHEIKRDPIC